MVVIATRRLTKTAASYQHRDGLPDRIISPVTSPCQEPAPPLLREGIEQFNRGKFFEQHETLEDLWREEQRPLRRLYQGILQIGVAMYHIQRRNHHGAVYMLTRGSGYLRPFAPSCQGVAVEDLLASARRLLELVERLGPNRLDEFDWNDAPQVRWIG